MRTQRVSRMHSLTSLSDEKPLCAAVDHDNPGQPQVLQRDPDGRSQAVCTMERGVCRNSVGGVSASRRRRTKPEPLYPAGQMALHMSARRVWLSTLLLNQR